jgi:hypothetical protein
LDAFLAYLRGHGAELGIDANRVLLFAAAANAGAGFPVAMGAKRTQIRAAVIYYGAGEPAAFRPKVPVLLVRAGLDDRLIGRAMTANAPLEVINYSGGHHAFDLRDDNAFSRDLAARTVSFMKSRMTPALEQVTTAGAADATAVSYAYAEDLTRAAAAYESLARRWRV